MEKDNDSKNQTTEEDLLVFQKAMKKVRPLKAQGKVLLQKKVVKKRPFVERPDEEIESKIAFLSDYTNEEVVSSQTHLFFAREGLSPKQLRRLKHGKINIQAILDLHGCDSQSAKEMLLQFIEQCYKKNVRCISIIHGKGHVDQPILKNKINQWLRQLEMVLAFCSAIPKDGGTGAVYVLLKNVSKHLWHKK